MTSRTDQQWWRRLFSAGPLVATVLAVCAIVWAVIQVRWFMDLVDHWQTLIAGVIGGVLTLLAGVAAYRGARGAAREQVAAVQTQLEDAQAARKEGDQRRLSVVKWAVRAEGKRLGTAVEVMKEALPSAPGWSPRPREQLVIETSPLLRGDREGIALLDDETRELLEKTANTLDAYNLRIRTAKTGDPVGGETTLIVQNALYRLEELRDLARELREV